MAKIEELVQGFLAQKKIAIVGVSDKRETGCNLAYKKFKQAGYTVYAVNPHLSAFDGDRCYPNLSAIPDKPEAVFILARPQVTDDIVRQCVELGVKHVWMHCMLGTKPGLMNGTTSVSPEAVALCQAQGINVIPGTCPNQFLNPDFGHNLMRVMGKAFGLMRPSQVA